MAHQVKHSAVQAGRSQGQQHTYLLNSAQSSLRMVLQAFLMMSMGRPVKEKRRVRPRGCTGTCRNRVQQGQCQATCPKRQCLYQHTLSYYVYC